VAIAAKLHPELTDQALQQVAGWVGFQAKPPKPIETSEPKAKLEDAQDKLPGPPDLTQVNNKDKLEPEIVLNPGPPAVAVQETPPPKETAPEKIITELPDIAVQGRTWLKGLPQDSFVLEHQTFTRLKDAQAYLKGKEWLMNARITPVYLEGQEDARFAVVTGHFKTKERAKNTIARLKLSSDVVVVAVPLALSQAQAPKPKP
jgi:septal ring-binding cell division protein DamX